MKQLFPRNDKHLKVPKKDYYSLLDFMLKNTRHYTDMPEVIPIAEVQRYAKQRGFTNAEVESAWTKLINENYVTQVAHNSTHKLTFNGYIFCENGMYKAQQRNKKINIFLNYVNMFVLAIAAIAASCYYTRELIIKPLSHTPTNPTAQYIHSLPTVKHYIYPFAN